MAAKDANVKRVVYACSASVYGNSEILPKREDMPANPASPYAISKYTGEQYCRAFYELYGLETVALRYFNVFGKRQNPNSQPISRKITNGTNGRIAQMKEGGKPRRHGGTERKKATWGQGERER